MEERRETRDKVEGVKRELWGDRENTKSNRRALLYDNSTLGALAPDVKPVSFDSSKGESR